VFRHEPGLKLIGANDLADDQVIRAVVTGISGLSGECARFLQDNLVSFQDPGDLNRNFLAAARGPGDDGRFDHIVSHGDADAAEKLNALGDAIDELRLLAKMFIEEQVELVKSVAGNLPVMFLVEVTQSHGVRQELIEICDALEADFFIERDGNLDNFAEGLNFPGTLVQNRLGLPGAVGDVVVGCGVLVFPLIGHVISSPDVAVLRRFRVNDAPAPPSGADFRYRLYVMVRVEREILLRMLEEARRKPDEECCGLLGGKNGIITTIFASTNAMASASAYEITPAELLRQMREIRGAGLEMMGIYHSHPNGENRPSATDVERAYYPEAVYFVISPGSGAAKAIRAFTIREGVASELGIESV
jgi:[CysO sulfur-carrier protein]-S-L-cysteine hydrolase